MGLFLACPSDSGSGSTPTVKDTPVKGDFTITGDGLFSATAAAGSPNRFSRVTATPKEGKSDGAITYKYEDVNKVVTNTPPNPAVAGVYNVTFDVAETDKWAAASDLSAGFVNITDNRQVPAITNFEIKGFPASWAQDNPPAVANRPSITKLVATLSDPVVSYKKTSVNPPTTSADFPTEVGNYEVSFTVAGNEIWNAAGFIAGGIVITPKGTTSETKTPTLSDFTVTGLAAVYNGSAQEVTVAWKGTAGGAISNITYTPQGADAPLEGKPVNAGTYAVTFDVGEFANWAPVTALAAGDMEIKKATPKVTDFNLPAGGTVEQQVGKLEKITITPKTDLTLGAVTIRYNGQLDPAKPALVVGSYPIVFDVAGTDNWNAVTELYAGQLVVTAKANQLEVRTITFVTGGTAEAYKYDPLPVARYTGNAITPTLGVFAGNTKLTLDTDYEVVLENNKFVTTDYSNPAVIKVTPKRKINDIEYEAVEAYFLIGDRAAVVEFDWADWLKGSNLTNNATSIPLTKGQTLVITSKEDSGYEIVEWRLDGAVVRNADKTPNKSPSYTFGASNSLGQHNVALIAKKGDKVYNTNIVVTVSLVN